MSTQSRETVLQRLMDKEAIRDTLCLYARGVDRGDWNLVRSTYHSDAYDDHGGYKGNIDGLIEWLEARFNGVDNSMHLLGNCHIDFTSSEEALVETYFVSRRFRPPEGDDLQTTRPDDAICREVWGRYVDRFERRGGPWRVAKRTVVMETMSNSVATGGRRSASVTWGRRNHEDSLYQEGIARFNAPSE